MVDMRALIEEAAQRPTRIERLLPDPACKCCNGSGLRPVGDERYYALCTCILSQAAVPSVR